jgi:restriction system protein
MMIPTLLALRRLGGSGTIDEIYEKVVEILALPEAALMVPHINSSRSEIEYRLAWSRTYLKKYGLLNNSGRGVWSLASTSIDIDNLDPKEVVRFVRESSRPALVGLNEEEESPDPIEDEVAEETWHQQLHTVLLSLQPSAFERLIQRLLRESGFIQVEVTGRSNDGGIDGIGIARINGFLSFHVLFQCKRYQGSVTPSQIRDFRGAMQGRTDKGLFVTTGTFTREAVKEATRDGPRP